MACADCEMSRGASIPPPGAWEGKISEEKWRNISHQLKSYVHIKMPFIIFFKTNKKFVSDDVCTGQPPACFFLCEICINTKFICCKNFF